MHVEGRVSTWSGPQSRLSCWETFVTTPAAYTRKGYAQRIIIIEKRLPDPQRNAELASGALVSSAPSSRDTGSRVIPPTPMSAERTNIAVVLFGRATSVGVRSEYHMQNERIRRLTSPD